MTPHPALVPGNVAVITGGASGIGLAAGRRCAGMGMKVVLADLPGERLDGAAREVVGLARGGPEDVRAIGCDVGRLDQVENTRQLAFDSFGHVGLLMNNAAIGRGAGPFADIEQWRRLLDVNLWGVINGVQAFAPAMIAQGRPAAIVNTGSKQGITTPPGNTAYNVSKAGVKVVTEALAHELRTIEGCPITAHLLIPGFTYTGITDPPRPEKPAGAWTADQVVEFMLEGMQRGDFYILCPDNDTTREMDNRRMQWAIDDVRLNRPALSRWHPDYEEAFARFMEDPSGSQPPVAPARPPL